MNKVYVVVATRDSEIEVCECYDYASVQSALGRAFQLASDKSGKGRTDLFYHSPVAETLPDGSVCWVFMDTNEQSVVVFCRKIESALLDTKDPMNIIGGISPIQNQKPYDFKDRELPVGWTTSGKPALMGELLDNAYSVKDPLYLTDDQKWALVVARIRKATNWKPNNPISYFIWMKYFTILLEVKTRSTFGQTIIDEEIDALHELYLELT